MYVLGSGVSRWWGLLGEHIVGVGCVGSGSPHGGFGPRHWALDELVVVIGLGHVLRMGCYMAKLYVTWRAALDVAWKVAPSWVKRTI